MTRWFTALLYALMFACSALPAQAALAAVPCTLASDGEQVRPLSDAIKLPGDTARVLGEPAHGDSGHELPELFLDATRQVSENRPTAQAVPQRIAVHVPSPYLKGPQRPPQANAASFA